MAEGPHEATDAALATVLRKARQIGRQSDPRWLLTPRVPKPGKPAIRFTGGSFKPIARKDTDRG